LEAKVLLRLTAAEMIAYDSIKRGLDNYATSIDLKGIDKNVDIMTVFKAVVHDNPQFIYFDNSQIGKSYSLFGKNLNLSGCLSKSQAMKMLNDAYAVAYPIIESARQKKDAYRQLITVYEQLQALTVYDEDELLASSTGRKRNQFSHNMYGALVAKKAVCDGFSAAFQYVAQHLGYRCSVISGKSDHSSYGNVNHAWNMVEIAGNYYHLDLTWDACHYDAYKNYSYIWFLLDDEGILADHTWDVNTTYAATEAGLSYYSQNGLIVDCEKDIIDVIINSIKNSGKTIRFKCSEKVWNKKPMDEYLYQLTLDTALKYLNRSVQMICDWSEKTRNFSAELS